MGAHFGFRDGELRQIMPLLGLWLIPLGIAVILAIHPRDRVLHLKLTAASILFILLYYWKWTLRT